MRLLRLALVQLWARPLRAVALVGGIVVATASFTVLTGAASTGRLETRGTITRSRAPYDILVRPRGSRSAVERDQQLLRPGAISGIAGGITLGQWRRVLGLPGTQIAAPIATLGYALPDVSLAIDVTRALPASGPALYRTSVRQLSDRGLSAARDTPTTTWVTRQRLQPSRNLVAQGDEGYAPTLAYPDGRQVPVCLTGAQDLARQGPFDRRLRGGGNANLECTSTQTGSEGLGFGSFGRRRGQVTIGVPARLPFVIAAVDPEQEAKLDGLDAAVLSGRYLRAADRPTREFVPRVPVLVADRPAVDEQVAVRVQVLPQRAARALQRATTAAGTRRAMRAAPAGELLRRTFTTADLYRSFLGGLGLGIGFAPAVTTYWAAGPTRLVGRDDDRLRPVAVRNPAGAWQSDAEGGYLDAPLSAEDVQFRRIRPVVGATQAQDGAVWPSLRRVGEFDVDRLTRGLRDAVGLSPFASGALEPADQASRRALGGRPLLPNGNIAGYQTQPPLLLTNLRSLPAFAAPNFAGARGDAPISAIRVRAAGVRGFDAASRERVRQLAAAIARDPRLDVDLTIGSSTQRRRIDLPAGTHGRPALTLTEDWVRKGVAVALLRAVDRKSVGLFALILVVCALFVANAVSAAVAARRQELAVMSCLGWPARRLFALVLTEAAVAAALAGVLGGLVALVAAPLLDVSASVSRAALAIPAAVGLALVAALVPALRASRAHPASAVRPAALAARVSASPSSLLGLACLGALRRPARSALAAASVAVGVAALTVLLAITLEFRGTTVGTVLGDAVALQVRTVDYVSAAVTVALGALAVADVLYLNLTEREAELAVLRASGWSDRHVAGLVGREGAVIGLTGAVLGVALGLLASWALTDRVPLGAAAIAGVVAAALAVLASLAPALSAGRGGVAEALKADV